VGDEATTKCFVKFMMGAEGEEKQIGDECEYFKIRMLVQQASHSCTASSSGREELILQGKAHPPVVQSQPQQAVAAMCRMFVGAACHFACTSSCSMDLMGAELQQASKRAAACESVALAIVNSMSHTLCIEALHKRLPLLHPLIRSSILFTCASTSSAAAGEYLLNVLIINKPTYKGLIVPGGKVDMMFTAKGFGKEDGEQHEDRGLSCYCCY
jgi:hypothetical protein